MTDADFIAALQVNPADDALRLVYADWLDERGDLRAEFLRADVELCRLAKTDEGYSRLLDRLLSLGEEIDRDWQGKAGKRFDRLLVSFEVRRKIETVKAIRDAVKMGLREALAIVEGAPLPILRNAVRSETESARRRFYSSSCGTSSPYPYVPIWGTLEIRPATTWPD